MKATSCLLLSLFLIVALAVEAKISESELKSYGAAFMAKAQTDNPEAENKIHKCLNGVIKEGSAGIRLIDKLGLFLYDCKKHDISLKKVRFFSRQEIFSLYIIMEERKEDQIYNLYLEYAYENGKCVLKDFYFSVVFEEKMRQLRKFFEFR